MIAQPLSLISARISASQRLSPGAFRMRAVVLLVAALLSFALPALAADDVANAQSVIRAQEEAFRRGRVVAAECLLLRDPRAGGGIPPRRRGRGLFLRRARHPADLSAGRRLHVDGPARLHAGLSPQEFRVRRGANGRRPDRPARPHRRRQWRSLGGALYAGATTRRQPENHRLRAAQGRTGGLAARQFARSVAATPVSAFAELPRARTNNPTTMAMLSAFQARPLVNAAA